MMEARASRAIGATVPTATYALATDAWETVANARSQGSLEVHEARTTSLETTARGNGQETEQGTARGTEQETARGIA